MTEQNDHLAATLAAALMETCRTLDYRWPVELKRVAGALAARGVVVARAPQGDPPEPRQDVRAWITALPSDALVCVVNAYGDAYAARKETGASWPTMYGAATAAARDALLSLAPRGIPAPQGDAAPPLDRRLKRIADEMPALRDFIRAEHGPIGWEHTLNIWITDLQKITALRGGASSSGSAPPSDKREADRREAAAFQRGVESVRGAPPNPGDQK